MLVPLLASLFLAAANPAAPPRLTVTVRTPVQSAIPQGAQRIPLLTLLLRASCDADIPVSTLTFQHAGKGATSDLLRVYVSDAFVRKTAAHSVSARTEPRLRLRQVTVPACETKELTLHGDFSRTAQPSGEHTFTLTGVEAKADVSIGSSSSSAGILRVTPHAEQPDVTATFRTVHTSKEYGDSRVLARVLLKGGSMADQHLLAITFTNDGSARNADLRNLYLETASRTRISAIIPQMDGDVVRFTLSPPLLLERNQEKLLQLRADVRASRTHTIDWTIDEPSDIEAEVSHGR